MLFPEIDPPFRLIVLHVSIKRVGYTLDECKTRIVSRKTCLCPLHKTTSNRSVFHLCNKISSSLMFLCKTHGSCYHVFTEAVFLMRQLAVLLSFWQNGFASNHFRGGKRGRKSESSKRLSIAEAVCPAVSRGIAGPVTHAGGCLMAPQPCSATNTSA